MVHLHMGLWKAKSAKEIVQRELQPDDDDGGGGDGDDDESNDNDDDNML